MGARRGSGQCRTNDGSSLNVAEVEVVGRTSGIPTDCMKKLSLDYHHLLNKVYLHLC